MAPQQRGTSDRARQRGAAAPVRSLLAVPAMLVAISQAHAQQAGLDSNPLIGSSTDSATAPAGAGTVGAIPPPLAGPDALLPATAAAGTQDFDDRRASNLQGPTLEPAARPWTFTPSIGAGEEYTDNVLAFGGAGRGSDLITLLLPGLNIAGDTPRLQGSVSYNPEIDIYARNSSQTQIDQNFSGNIRAAIVPGTVFVNLRGYGAVTANGLGGQPGTGPSGQFGIGPSAANQATQTVDLAATPYVLHRFGTLGTGEVGGTIERTTQDSVNGVFSPQGGPVSPFVNPGNQDATTVSGHAAFATGEAFGRYSGTALIDGAHTSGTGVLSSATRDTASIDNGYAVTRNITALVEAGYEHIRYAGTSPLRIDDATWDVGFRLRPAPDSSLELRYGHHDGLNAATLDAALQTTARTTIYLRYSKGLSTESELLQNALATTDLDQLGDPVDHNTGTPLLLSDNFFGAQQNLYRTQLASATAVLTEDRDIVSAGFQFEDNKLISSSGVPGSLGSNNGVYGTLDWSHELSPTLSLTFDGQYGVRTDAGPLATTDDVTFLSLALVKTLSQTLSAQLRYSYNNVSSGQRASNYSANVVLFTVTKSFR